jgi:hypothetical protein
MGEVLLTSLAGDTLIYNTSTIGVSAYTDYSMTKKTDLYLTGTYDLTLKRNSNFNNITWTVYADLNQDGFYDGPDDKLAEISNTTQTTWKTQIYIPAASANVLEGLTKLRVVANAGILSNKGCGPNYSGEYEDYGLVIKADDVPPVIYLYDYDSTIVSSPDTIILNSCANWTSVDPGHFAWDDVSGDLTTGVIVGGVSAINPLLAGYYPLTYDVQDNALNDAVTAIRVVEVLKDIVPPEINFSGNEIDSMPVFGTYTFPGYNVTDNCSGVKSQLRTGTVDGNTTGMYYITYDAEDNAGNKAQRIRTVVVYDGMSPTIALRGADTVYVEAMTAYVEDGVTITDNYNPVLIETVKGFVDTTALGTYFLTYCVTDSSGNGPVCVDRIVIVEDKTAPTLTFDTDTFTLDVFKPFSVPMYYLHDTYWPNEYIIVTKTGTVNTYMVGVYPLIFVATDASGNMSTPVTIYVNVVDRVDPEIELEGSSLVTVLRWNTFDEPGYVLRDNYYKPEELTLLASTGTFVSTQEVGLYSITYQVQDPSGNKSNILTRFVYVSENVSIDEEVSENNFSYYPNPVNELLNIDVEMTSHKLVRIAIYNALGEQVVDVNEGVIMNEHYELNVSKLSAGMYYIRFDVGSDSQFNKKFIIAR